MFCFSAFLFVLSWSSYLLWLLEYSRIDPPIALFLSFLFPELSVLINILIPDSQQDVSLTPARARLPPLSFGINGSIFNSTSHPSQLIETNVVHTHSVFIHSYRIFKIHVMATFNSTMVCHPPSKDILLPNRHLVHQPTRMYP